MNLKRTMIMAVGCAAFAAWLSAAMAPRRPPVPLDSPVPGPAEMNGAALASEIQRLHERLRPDSVPRAQPRNLFAFRPQRQDVPVAPPTPPSAVVEAPAPAAVAPFALSLIGLAEDPAVSVSDVNGGVIRTAVIAAHGQVFLAKEGDTIVDRDVTYVVGKISSNSVEVADQRDDTVHRLALK